MGVTSTTARTSGPTRRRLPREARSRQLLDVAEVLFAERGVQASSMEDIADRAGVTKPVVYDHFGSKDRLVAAVILRAGGVLGQSVLAAVAAADGQPEAAVADGLRAYFGFIEERRSGLHSLLTEGVAPGSEAAAALEAVRDQQAQMIAGLLLAHGAETDHARAQTYAQIVVGATERLATRPGVDPSPPVDSLVQHVMDVIWCGLGALRTGQRWDPAAG